MESDSLEDCGYSVAVAPVTLDIFWRVLEGNDDVIIPREITRENVTNLSRKVLDAHRLGQRNARLGWDFP